MFDLKTHLYAKFGNAINLETLVKTKESCNEEVTKLDEVKAQMSDLKTHLYAKFGNAINLENDE